VLLLHGQDAQEIKTAIINVSRGSGDLLVVSTISIDLRCNCDFRRSCSKWTGKKQAQSAAMRCPSLYAWLLLLVVLLNDSSPAAAQAAPVVKVAGSSGKTTCSLNIQGNSAGDRIKSARMSCTGAGSVTVAVQQQLQDVLVLKGVKTAEKGTCQLKGDPCLLLLCRSDVEFISPVINGIKSMRGVGGVLCFDFGSKITMRKGRFTSNGMPTIGIFGPGTSVLVDECSVEGNRAANGHGGGIKMVDADTLRVQSSTFKANSASVTNSKDGGALYLASGATTIVDSIFQSNQATNGGAIFLIGKPTVSIQGSQFVGNMAGSNGAAISAEGTAQVDILPAATEAPGMYVGTGGGAVKQCDRLGAELMVDGRA
jgi:hypothetical protein